MMQLPLSKSDPCLVVSDFGELVRQGAKFGTVYADPPWQYDNRASRGAASNHYKTMSLDEIKALPVEQLAAASAQLHLWTTTAFLSEGLDLLAAWGFTYRSQFVWCKPQMGVGNYWRVSHEIMLLGVRGDCPPWETDLPSCAVIPRSKHSTKPDQVRTMLERVNWGPFLELFGRVALSGWTVFGNQVEQDMFSQGAGYR